MKKILAALCLLLFWAGSALATYWNGGVHTVGDGESHPESEMANNATLLMTGGYIQALNVYDTSHITVTGGHIDYLDMRGSSTAILMNGQIDHLAVKFPDALTPPEVCLYVEDYILDTDAYVNYDRLTGTWLNSPTTFDILVKPETAPYLCFVPEPTTLAGVVFGGAFLRIRHHISNNV